MNASVCFHGNRFLEYDSVFRKLTHFPMLCYGPKIDFLECDFFLGKLTHFLMLCYDPKNELKIKTSSSIW